MENQSKKIGFFSRVKIAVTKLENYGMFLEEKTSIAVKYFFLIVLVLSVVMTAVETYVLMQMVSKGCTYIKNELPEFSYVDGNLSFSETVQAYDEEYDFYMITDTEEVPEEKLQTYKNNIKNVGIIFLKDKAIYKTGGSEFEYQYKDFAEQYGISNLDKAGFIQEIDQVGLIGMAIGLFLIILFGVYIFQLVSVFMDWIVISVFAFIAARICRISMQMRHAWNISIYALTLSIILSMLYNIAYYCAGFYTEYFRIVYLLIAYVYVVAVILMIKSDVMRQQIEVSKIVKIQKEVEEEQHDLDNDNHDKPEKKDKKEEKKPEDTIDEEPDGSEI